MNNATYRNLVVSRTTEIASENGISTKDYRYEFDSNGCYILLDQMFRGLSSSLYFESGDNALAMLKEVEALAAKTGLENNVCLLFILDSAGAI